MRLSPHHIRHLNGDDVHAAVPRLAAILKACVEGGASVGFMAPLDLAKAIAFWRGVATEAAAGRRLLFVGGQGGTVFGTVQLVPAVQENQPHRAEIAKLLVHPEARRTGLAEALMRAAEAAALTAGRTLLFLDTEAGSAADRLYRRLGWVPVGTVPRYALMPDGGPCPATFFYRDLAA